MAEEFQKHTLNLYPGDYERIQALYPDIGAAPAIRRLIHQWLENVDAAAEPRPKGPEIEI